ncbi:MAG: DNRLRE domain-containing protein [Chitinophagaceae bacterium]|nr:DNRLRE domain-containing protein [Chitinophagaceae bacterium]MBP6478837.1 DNRLRE domain-containing protein [Chitinophagaceae bacterium]MBP7108206.1 DNRLRE domain-containing protein [Chitinophagaceae bacterium]
MRIHFKKIFALLFVVGLFIGCQKENDFISPQPPTAEAGNSQSIQSPTTSFTLAGSGVSTNGPITGYLWSLVSGPNVPLIASPGSPTTLVTNFIAGTYTFQLMVIDNAGLTGIDTTKITVTAAPIQTLTLQPANNTEERHLWGNSTMDQSGHATELVAGTWTSGGTIYIRGALKFNLSTIPSSATILTAKLTLFSNPTPLNGTQTVPNEGPGNAMYIRRITNNWNPVTTFWLTQPATTTTDQISIPHTAQASLDLVDVDVKNLVTAMHSSGNYGFMIMLQNETPFNMRNFCSSIHTTASKHPKIVITYQP